jgi:hypothetical protein
LKLFRRQLPDSGRLSGLSRGVVLLNFMWKYDG